jgi:ribosomal protein S18 acetylase RimI-like enzyme
MEREKTGDVNIVNTTNEDLEKVLWLFEEAISLQGKNGYKVWDGIDKPALGQEMEKGLQYKIAKGEEILCIFSIQFSDPFIWREKDKNDALYLHRIVVNPNFKGQRLFEKVLNWATNFARQKGLGYIRMDTWADNLKIINYYKSFGFEVVENYKTNSEPQLPVQNRNLNVALLQLTLMEK